MLRMMRCNSSVATESCFKRSHDDHLHVKVIGRKSGSSAVASAAYRSGSRLRDERIDRSHDFSAKRDVVHSEVLLPENAPEAHGATASGCGTMWKPPRSERTRNLPARSNSPFRVR